MNVAALMLLLEVVDAGSFAEAARRTGVPKSTVSRKLRELEEELGARLLQRTTRRLGTTEAGRRLVEHARSIADTLERARQEVRARGEGSRGTLRVTTSVSAGERILLPLFVRFMREHPNVRLELVLGPEARDLIADHIDVALRIGEPEPKSPLVARRLAEAASYPCASPSYLEDHGAPETFEDLRKLDGVFYRTHHEGTPAFVLEDGSGVARRVAPAARMIVNSHIVVRAAVLDGLGVGCLPAPFCREAIADGRLVRVLPPLRTPKMWVYAAFPSHELPAAARAFVDFIASHADPSWWQLED